MAYDNILNAVKGPSKLTPAQEVENYNAFADLQKQGVFIPDLLKRIGDMETRLAGIETSRKEADADLFAVMEQAVKNEQSVKDARAKVSEEKSRIISEMCMRDERYRQAVEEYRRAVNAEYIRQKEPQEGPQKARGRTISPPNVYSVDQPSKCVERAVECV